MARFRDIKTLQKFASIHASIHNHFNHQRHLNRRGIFKQARATALAEWRSTCCLKVLYYGFFCSGPVSLTMPFCALKSQKGDRERRPSRFNLTMPQADWTGTGKMESAFC